MNIKEIKLEDLKPSEFVKEQSKKISSTVKDGSAINALSGGVDSSVVTMIGHRALGKKLKTYFIENGLMRQDEPQRIADLFKKMGAEINIVQEKRGHYPRGGGQATVTITPIKQIKAMDNLEFGDIAGVSGISHCVRLPSHVADRQASAAESVLLERDIKVKAIQRESSEKVGPVPSGI